MCARDINVTFDLDGQSYMGQRDIFFFFFNGNEKTFHMASISISIQLSGLLDSGSKNQMSEQQLLEAPWYFELDFL